MSFNCSSSISIGTVESSPEPQEINRRTTNKFNIVPGQAPSDNVRKVLKDMSFHTDAESLISCVL